MPYKKKATPGTVKFYRLAAELPEKKQEKIKTQVQFRHDLLESQKRIKYQNEFDRLQGAKKNCQDWMSTQNQECKNYKRKQGNH